MKESRTLEYKAEITNTFLKTVSAFANFGTGRIEFGISDDGSVCGISNPKQACLDIENKINDSISPKPEYSLKINYRTNVITLTVAEGAYKPYLYNGKAYRRSDTATIEADQLELKRLTLEGSNLYYEELPANAENYTFYYLEQKLQEKLNVLKLTEDILRTFGFYTKDKRLNNAGALLADKNAFPGIDIVRFGKNISEIRERATIAGVSVLEQYDGAVALYHRYYQYEKIQGVDRVSAELIPEVAFREAVANALIHRTWDVTSHIRIYMYEDRIEIASPGGLPRGLSEDEYLNGMISNLRNPILGNIFFRLHYIEMFGTGIRRIRDAYTLSAAKPLFNVFDNSVQIMLPITEKTVEVTTDGKRLMEILRGGMRLSSSELCDASGWNKAKVIRVMNTLKEAGYVEVYGNGRGTKYGLKT